MDKKIAIYPGRFQPMGRHHVEVFKKIQDEYGVENTFISTSNKVDAPRSPFDFSEKQKIAEAHGIDPLKVVMTKNPYVAKEILDNFNPDTTAAIYFVGSKDMEESPRFANLGGLTKKGTPRYFRKFNPQEELKSFMEHGYIAVAPHVGIDIKDVGEMSGAALRTALKDADANKFERIMGFSDSEVMNMIQAKLSSIEEMSSMGGGSVAGYSAPLHKKDEDDLVERVMNYLLKTGDFTK